MTEEQCFLHKIIEDPYEEAHQFAFSDWLEEKSKNPEVIQILRSLDKMRIFVMFHKLPYSELYLELTKPGSTYFLSNDRLTYRIVDYPYQLQCKEKSCKTKIFNCTHRSLYRSKAYGGWWCQECLPGL